MKLLKIEELNKSYGKFCLKNISFALESGYIMGFIGRNGAGKTTTLKSIMNIIHPDSGKITVCGKDFSKNEYECKQKIGFASGGIDYYPKAKIKAVTDVTKRFYHEWDDKIYSHLMMRFELDENKRIEQLSEGMKVKYSLALAFSHNARILILDEPTSGLDPVSRDDIIMLFQEFIEDGEHSILFSTHITSDLEKCADYITYIKNGEILDSDERDSFTGKYKSVKGTKNILSKELSEKLIGCCTNQFGFESIIKTSDVKYAEGCQITETNLEEIMVHLERKNQYEKSAL